MLLSSFKQAQKLYRSLILFDTEPIPDADLEPRSMRHPKVRERRLKLLRSPKNRPLVQYVEQLRASSGCEVPNFDPLDGGCEAQLVFFLEKPGPMTSEQGRGSGEGSGFISMNNDDPTAEATYKFVTQAGIAREKILLWNVIPWWNGTRKVKGEELLRGVEEVQRLMNLLVAPRAVVLVGAKAGRAEKSIQALGIPTFTSDHPSPLVRARYPKRWSEIPVAWAKAALAVGVV